MTFRTFAVTGLAAVALLGVVGCAPTAARPTAEPVSSTAPSPRTTTSATPSPSSTPAPIPALIEIDADGFTVRTAKGEELDSHTYLDDPEVVVASLTAVFRAEPATSHHPSDNVCSPETTSYTWESFSLSVSDDNFTPTYAVGSDTSGEGSAVRAETAAGGRVGGSLDDLLETIPDALRHTVEWEGERLDFVLESLGSHDGEGIPDEDRHGARIVAVDGVITHISAPSLLNNPC